MTTLPSFQSFFSGVTAPKTFWLPRQASNLAADVDWNWGFVYAVSIFFFVLVIGVMLYFAWRYRSRPGHTETQTATHNTPLELFWTIVPSGIVVVMFWFGYTTYLDMATPPQNAYEINVTAQKWNWQFAYPNGYIDSELHVPVDTAIRLVMSSPDVMHSFFVPQFRVKRDVIPGRYNKVWFTAVETGVFDVYCTEYCGKDHSNMLSKVHVHERGEFDAWLEEASDFLSRMPPAEAGALLYNQRGCKQCHSVDGSGGTGPSFLQFFGSQRAMTGGEVISADENYVRESILTPQAKVSAGFDPVMPTYQGRLKDEEISAIIEYLKTLGEGAGS